MPKTKIINEPEYSKIIGKLGGRKFLGVILATLLVFAITIGTMILQTTVILTVISSETVSFNDKDILEQLWSFCKTVVPAYLGLLAAYSGLQILQKKTNGTNGNSDNSNVNENEKTKREDYD